MRHVTQVRRNLHVVLCFSPVGEKFQVRARQFPALVSCLTYDYFHTWPQEVHSQTLHLPFSELHINQPRLCAALLSGYLL